MQSDYIEVVDVEVVEVEVVLSDVKEAVIEPMLLAVAVVD
jgi:hypothetical protein